MESLTQIRDVTTGRVVTFDEHNHTVLDNGRKSDYIDHDPDGAQHRDFSSSNVHVSQALTNFAIDYGTQDGLAIADLAAPVLLVDKASDTYHTFSANDKFRRVNAAMADEDADIAEVGPTKSTDTYTTAAYGLSTFVSQGVEANADPVVQPRMRAMRRIMNAMVTEREHRTADALLNTTTFTSYSSTLTSSNYWDDGASSDPRKDVITAIESLLAPCTHMALSEKSWNRFVHNVQVAKYGIYTGMGVNDTPTGLMERLGFPYITPLIGRMRSESTTAGTTTKSYVWDDDAIFLHIPSGAGSDPEEVPTARTFRWLKGGLSRNSGGFRIREWDVPERGQDGGRKLAVVVNEVVKVTAADCGYLFINVW